MNNSESLRVGDIPGKRNFNGKKISPDAIVFGRENTGGGQDKLIDGSEKLKAEKQKENWLQALEYVATDKRSQLIKTAKKILAVFGLSTALAAAIKAGEEPAKLPELKKDAWEETMRQNLGAYENDNIALDFKEDGSTATVTTKSGEYHLADDNNDGYVDSGNAYGAKSGAGSVELEAGENGMAPQVAISQMQDKLRNE